MIPNSVTRGIGAIRVTRGIGAKRENDAVQIPASFARFASGQNQPLSERLFQTFC